MDDVDALTMTEENPLYKRFLKKKDKFLASQKKIVDEDNLNYYKSFNDSEKYDLDAYVYLCYITRKYFSDNCLISIIKILVGVFSIIFAVIIEKTSGAVFLKGLIMVGFFSYGLIMIPVSFLYLMANFICFCKYLNYVSTSHSTLARTIIEFYDENTDKFQAVNWKHVVHRDSADFHESHRKKGW